MAALHLTTRPAHWGSRASWRHELPFAAPIVAFILYLFYVWFAVRDRYQIFLYFHNMGPGFDTTPFGRITASRYWMAGLVASGAVMVLYLAAAVVAGRVAKRLHAPAWWRLWLLCALPLAIGIPAIVMTVSDPVLPLGHAARVTTAALLGLAVAVSLGSVAAGRPLALLLILGDVSPSPVYWLPSSRSKITRAGWLAAELVTSISTWRCWLLASSCCSS